MSKLSSISNVAQAAGSAAMTAKKFGMPIQVVAAAAVVAGGHQAYKAMTDKNEAPKEDSVGFAARLKEDLTKAPVATSDAPKMR